MQENSLVHLVRFNLTQLIASSHYLFRETSQSELDSKLKFCAHKSENEEMKELIRRRRINMHTGIIICNLYATAGETKESAGNCFDSNTGMRVNNIHT